MKYASQGILKLYRDILEAEVEADWSTTIGKGGEAHIYK